MGKFEKAADKAIAKNQKKLVPVSDKDVEFLNTSSSKDYDDDGYEEGKSKDRERFLSLGELLKMNPGAEGEAKKKSKEERDAARAQVRDEAKVKKEKKKKD
jgi:hypothetical protein